MENLAAKMLSVFILLISIYTCNGAHHHWTSMPDCFGHTCDANAAHEACVVNTHNPSRSYCGSTHHCGYATCSSNTIHNQHCCCLDMACVTYVKNNLPSLHAVTSTPVPITVNNVKCSTCSDYKNGKCSQSTTTCGPNEVCKIQQITGGPVQTKCEDKHLCQSHKLQGDKNGTIITICCESNHCSDSAHNMSVSGLSNILHCSQCTDAFMGSCSGDVTCAAGEVCMIGVNQGRLESGCTDSKTCSSMPAKDTFCCSNSSCSDYAIKHIHQSAPSCPLCTDNQDGKDCLNSMTRCSHTAEGCSISHGKTGYSAACISDFDACNTTMSSNNALCYMNPVPVHLINGTCNYCCEENNTMCIQHSLGQHSAMMMTTTPMTMTTDSSITQQTTNLGVTSITQQTTNPVAPTASGCKDVEDANFSCKTYIQQYDICNMNSPNAMHIAYTRCQKSCGHCGEVEPTSSSSNTGSSSTSAPVTADPNHLPKCVDVGSNCQDPVTAMICNDTNENLHNYAVANCALSCNLCTEYANMLAQLQSGRK